MTDQPTLHGIEVHVTSPGYDSETILVEGDDDVEAHGVRGAAAALAIVAASAGGAFLAHSGTALAPEPARLNSTLYSSGASSATWINTNAVTYAYFLSSSWTPSSLPAGYPCSTVYPLAAGTTLYKVIQASGNYRRCY
jgi:hypothetical protein